MEFQRDSIDGLVIIKPSVFGDDRGFFMESYNEKAFKENGIDANFVQDNHSKSAKGILRGMHFQAPPFAQGKLVRVVRGAVLDVAVDLRVGSPSYGQYKSVELNEENKLIFYIPEGFAHGFLSLEDNTIIQYLVDNDYSPENEISFNWQSNETIKEIILSEIKSATNLVIAQKDLLGFEITEDYVETIDYSLI
jgi:dTDP-4-dehydrorhamnose 3,5-epimerase